VRRRRSEEQPVSDINITPLTDVMMVLLIIFMISSPILMAKGLEVHLPQVEGAQQLLEKDHVLYMAADGGLLSLMKT
jgi:biopolymer transport protein ExbD